MRQRPLCAVFLSLIFFIIVAKALGFILWREPTESLRTFVESVSDTNCVIYGKVKKREEKTDSISYFLEDSYLIKDVSFKDADIKSLQSNRVYPLNNINLYLSKENPKIAIESEIIVFGKPNLYENASNPGGFDAADYYAADNCCIYVFASDVKICASPKFSFLEIAAQFKKNMNDKFTDLMDEISAALLSAILFGDKSELTYDMKSYYSAAGISHILAISGMHIAIIGALIYKLFLTLGFRIKSASFMSAGVVIIYCVFTGSGESTTRATIMFAVMQLGRCLLKNYDPLSSLSFAGIIMLAFRPMAFFRAGFQLSFAASAAVSCVAPVIRHRENKKRTGNFNLLEKIKTVVFGSLYTWISVSIVTFPIILYHYYEFPTYSVIANIIFVPLMSLVIISGLLGAPLAFLLPGLARIVLFLPKVVLLAQNEVGKAIMKLPFSFIIIGKPGKLQMAAAFACLMIFVMFINGGAFAGKGLKRSLRLACLAAPALEVIICAIHLPAGFSLAALDVGQGDCLIIRNNGFVYMVDGGSSSESDVGQYTIIPYLKSLGITQIEGVFLTHDDEDHYNGIYQLFEQIADKITALRVKYFFMPEWMRENETGTSLAELARSAGIEIVFLSRGSYISDEEMSIEVLNPNKEGTLYGNEGSLVLSVKYGKFKALLTGDLEDKGEDNLLGTLGSYDYLKAAHHGSRNSSSEEFLSETSPQLCVISAPKTSLYGHPHKETIERLEAAGVFWLQTGICGAITLKSDGAHMKVETYK